MKRKRYRTDFLVPKTSFLVGLGSIFNISGNYFDFNTSESGAEADSKAIESDWAMIGQDINNVLDKVDSKDFNLIDA